MASTFQHRRRAAFSPDSADIIAPEAAAPVLHFRRVFPGGDIIDAEYEEIAAGQGDAVASVAVVEAPVRAIRPSRHDSVAGRLNLFGRSLRLTTRQPARRGAAGFAAATAALCLLSFWLCGGHAAAMRMFAPAPKGNSLAIADVSTRLGLVDGITVATIDGTVRNDTAERLTVPPIAVSPRAGAGQEILMRAAAAALEPGQSTGFRARLALPEGSEAAVSVRFDGDADSAPLRP